MGQGNVAGLAAKRRLQLLLMGLYVVLLSAVVILVWQLRIGKYPGAIGGALIPAALIAQLSQTERQRQVLAFSLLVLAVITMAGQAISLSART